MPAATLQQITDYDPYIAHLLYSTHSVLVFVYLAHGLPCNSVHMSTGLLHYDVLDGSQISLDMQAFRNSVSIA